MSSHTHTRTIADIPIIHYGQVDSTMNEANEHVLNLAEEGHIPAPGGLCAVISTDHQTRGKARRERIWEEQPGSSVLATFIVGRSSAAPMSTVTHLIVCVAEVIRNHGAEVSIKWPNDLVVESDGNTKKIAGVLSEIVSPYLLVGIGINLVPEAVPPSLVDQASSLADNGANIDAEDLIDDIVRAYTSDGRTDNEMWEKYNALSSTRGHYVRVETMSGIIKGRALRILNDGSLVVDDGTEHVITEGDVIHLRPA